LNFNNMVYWDLFKSILESMMGQLIIK
jgi:hypothetical protein